MELQLVSQPIESIEADLIVVGAGVDWQTDLAELDNHFDGHLLQWAKQNKFSGKAGTTLKLPGFGRISGEALLLAGIGKGTSAELLTAAGHAGREARKAGATSIGIQFGAISEADINTLAETVCAGNYEFERYKAESARRAPLSQLMLANTGINSTVDNTFAVRAKWQNVARDLVNLPPADMYPETLADAALELAKLPHVEVEIWDFERCREEGCVGIIAVGQGSANPGCLIHIKYSPPNANGHVALVGKGVTFDSGGLSLKPSGAMQTMRCDMGGAATMLGAAGAIAELGTPIQVDTFIGAVENMAGANSYKLGDILKYNNGVTVEIHNTDAEGRLVMADCLIQAGKLESVTHVLDAATLTGACVVALGEDFTGIFTDDDALYGDLAQCAKMEGEGLWRLPLHRPYNAKLKSEWAQLKNVGGRAAGSTTAALFLEHFVDDRLTWAHLDVAGSAFNDKAHQFYSAGATGQMVRTIASWAKYRAENH